MAEDVSETQEEKLTQKEILFKEIDLIQGAIERMSRNSIEIKKWTVGLLAVLATLLKTSNGLITRGTTVLFVAIIVIFWYLNAYFLWLERRYRYKYDWVIKNRYQDGPDAEHYLFDMSPHNPHMILREDIDKFKQCKCSVMFSSSLWPLYVGLIAVCIFAF